MRRIFFVGALLLMTPAQAHPPPSPHAGEIAQGLRRLGVVGSVLYVAAHPDDENTRLLAWLVGERGLRAGYLSMTRGDGGQNLIGTEQDELLGLIRTHELLAARRIDGAEQHFTRARDFGYSKSADETMRTWGHDAVLSDVVLAMRRFRPDVVITRFTTRPPNHGHHTASAILAAEAFAAAADPKQFPEQLTGVKPWQPNRLLQNVSTWWLKPGTDMSMYLKVDVGGFSPLLGQSWGELAARSRSQHRSQGFGVAPERGSILEYFQPLEGTKPQKDIFEGLDFTWRRYPGTDALQRAIDAAVQGYDLRAPHKSLSALAKIHEELTKLPDDNPWKLTKLREAEDLLAACAGLFVEARAAEASAAPGDPVTINVVALRRTPAPVKLHGVKLPNKETIAGGELKDNEPFKGQKVLTLPADAPISTPYWLRHPSIGGLYDVRDPALIGRPEGDPALQVVFDVEVGGRRLALTRPVSYAWTDPVRGELYREFEVVPPVTATMDRDVVMFANGKPAQVDVALAAGRANAAGTVKLEVPAGWKVEPAESHFTLTTRGDERTYKFVITPPKSGATRGEVRAVTTVGGVSASWRARHVNHEHIPPQTVRQAAVAALVPVTLTTKLKRVGYIPGPGDRVAEGLSAVGYDVTILPDERLASEALDRYEAIVVGVRAFNANPRLAVHHEKLMRYVENGGNLVVQYNTNSRVGPLTAPIGPYPLEISRDRVTDETAAMTPLDPRDPVVTTPNRLEAADYAGWVQERGLYFANKWDPKYRPVFTMHDPGEEPLKGSLLVAKHGKGTFVYTGIAFFRQIPAGVPGAYRLLANVLAL